MVNTVRAFIAVIAVAAVIAAVPSAQTAGTSSVERAFPPNGRVKLNLAAADYRITGAAEPRVRIAWTVRDPNALPKVAVHADVRGSEFSVTTNGPYNVDLRFTVQVPDQSDLFVRLTAGDLTIEGVRGNKDVELRAGDLRIDVGRAEDYHSVDASLWAGDIKASAFQVVKDGLFRSFDWTGHGPYRLHARLLAGDLYLYSKTDGR